MSKLFSLVIRDVTSDLGTLFCDNQKAMAICACGFRDSQEQRRRWGDDGVSRPYRKEGALQLSLRQWDS
jgi:hypothetical protein